MQISKPPSAGDLPVELLQKKYRETRGTVYLAEIFCRYTHGLFAVCMGYLKDEDQAKEAIQEIFIKISVAILKTDVQNFDYWLFTIAKNHCLAVLKKKKISIPLDLPENIADDPLDMELLMKNEEMYNKLETCLKTLSPEQNMAVTMFYFERKTYNEISAETGKNWGMVRSLIQNGRKNLKTCLQRAK